MSTLHPRDLNMEVSGPEEGRPLLLLHGWGSSAELMRPIAEALNDTFHVFNVDMPGHGQSPEPPAALGLPEHAALVGDLIGEEIGKPVTILGHSNGGRIALYMASDPDLAKRIERLILISPSGIPAQRSWTYHLRRMTADALKAPFQLLPEGPLRDFGLDWLRHSLLWRALGSSDYQKLDGVMRGTFVKTVNHYVDDRIARIQVPTLLFWGDQDEAISEHQMRVLETTIPDAGLVVLDGAGHYGYLEDPATFLSATRHFLESADEVEAGEPETPGT